MSGAPRALLGALALVVLLTALATAAWLVWGPPWQGMQVWIDGRPLHLPDMHAGHWLVAAVALVAMFALLSVLVPTVLLLAIGLPLAVAAIVLAVVFSPLVLLALLVGWLLRRDRRAPPPA